MRPGGPTAFAIARQHEAVLPALEEMRATAAFRLSSARAGVAAAMLLAALTAGIAGQSGWLTYAPTLALYCAATLGLLGLQRIASVRAVAAACVPFLDLVCVFSLHLRRLPGDGSVTQPSLALFVLVVLLSAFTLRSGLVWATAIAAWACSLGLGSIPGAGGPSALVSGAVLLSSAALCSWATARMQEGVARLVEERAQGQKASELSEELVARLVHEEVQSRLATERSEELSRANNHIAQVNTILKDQHRKLQLAQREAEKLTALLVHDMKGPLSSVLGFVELVAMQLGAKPEAQGQVKHLKTALAQGRRLLDMIESLLAIARLERGAATVKREELDVLPLLQAVVNAQSARAQTQGVLLGAQAEPDLRAAFDRDLMQRVLENLVANALGHTKDADRVELSAALENGELVLAVRNSGPPVPEELRNSLFERFVTSAKPGRGNVGLGLYFCRLVAEAHQGTVRLEDAPGWSVSFVMRVPAGIPGLLADPPKPALLPEPAQEPLARA